MDMVSTGNIPVAAGLSSSSAIVVAVMEALVALNCLNLTEREFIDLCGEGEWFVGVLEGPYRRVCYATFVKPFRG